MNTFNGVIVRHCRNDFHAIQTSDAMQSIGGVEVLSVVCQPIVQIASTARIECRWHVFAKYDSSRVTPAEIDDVIAATLSG